MESLDDTFGPRVPTGSRRTRLLVGAGLLLGGVPLSAFLLHGWLLDRLAGPLGAGPAAQTAIALGGLFVPVAFAAAVLRLPASRPVKLSAVAGVVLATISAALFLITVPTGAFRAGTIPASVAIPYLLGTVMAAGAPLATIAAAVAAESTSTSRPTAWAGPNALDDRPRVGTVRSTDGGREPDRLAFLLDED